MTGRMDFKIQGLSQLQELLKAIGPKEARKISDNALRAGGRLLRTEARARVSRRSGDLARSMVVRSNLKNVGRQLRGSRRTVLVGFLRDPAGWRAHFQEFGTKKQPARPFLRPAFDENVTRITQKIIEVIGAGLASKSRVLKGRRASFGSDILAEDDDDG